MQEPQFSDAGAAYDDEVHDLYRQTGMAASRTQGINTMQQQH